MGYEKQLPKDILRHIDKYRMSKYKNPDDEISKPTRLIALIEKRCKNILGVEGE